MSIKKIAQSDKTVFKHNFVDLIRSYVPDLYIDEDINLSGVENDRMYEFLEQMVQVIGDLSSHIYVSGYTSTNDIRPLFSTDSVFAELYPDQIFKLFKNIDDFEVGHYSKLTVPEVIKQYKLASIKAAEEFTPLRDFDYYLNAALSKLTLNSPSPAYLSSIESDVINMATAHEYLFNNYGWLYVLNTHEAFDSNSKWDTPRKYLIRELKKTVVIGDTFTLANGVSAFLNYIWNSRIL